MLIQVDDEVLLGAELADQLLGGHVPDRALLAFRDLGRLHGRYFRNYRKIRRRPLRIAAPARSYCGNVRESGLIQNQILNLNYSGVVTNYFVGQKEDYSSFQKYYLY